jgi:hypothetical protein
MGSSYLGAWVGTARITKSADRPDGAVEIEGTAQRPERDKVGELITAEAMARAWPRFLRSWPALRVMHRPEPAGKVLDAQVLDDGTSWVRCLVVAEEPARLVKAGVLAGLSIGGTVDKRDPEDPTIITDLSLRELSLCDVPMLDAARIDLIRSDLAKRYAEPSPGDTFAKVAGLERERDEALAKAAALGRRVQKFMGERDAARSRLAKAARAHAAEVGRLTAERDRYFVQAAAKGSLRAIEISKADDNGTREPARQPEPDDPLALIRKAHARPGQLFDPPRR